MIRFFIALARLYLLMARLTWDSALVLVGLKVLPPTGDAVFYWRLR